VDDLDRRLLDLIQDGFPLAERPYQALGESLGATEEAVIERMASLVDRGIIRDASPVFDLHKLGYCSTLVALNVPEERLEDVAALVNERAEVTHNYLREGEPNLWFTVIAESGAARDAILAEIEREADTGRIYPFPATRMFRARVVFDFAGGADA